MSLRIARGLCLSLVALLYNWAFFTVLAYAPLILGFGAIALGAVFFGWGLLVAIFAVVVAPRPVSSALCVANISTVCWRRGW